jgi:NADH dehydrogenase
MMNQKRPVIIVIGGGFGGIKLIKGLKNKPYEIILIDRQNHHTFQPLLYQVASCGLTAASITAPFRRIFKGYHNFRFRMAIVERIDPERKEVFTANGTYKYDFLVIATGSITDYYDNEVLEQHSLSLKSVTDALTIRSTLLREFEMAVTRMHTDEKKILLNFIIIGAGATGVEIAGALAEFKKHIVPVDYPELDPGLMNIHVIEASNKVLRRMSPAASAKSQEYLEKMGVKVWLNTRVENYDGLNVTLTDGTVLRSVCFIWSAGVKGAVIPGLMKEIIQEGNRYKVDSFNRVEGYSNIYALGDVAAMISKDIPVGHPLVALPAMQQGANLARNFLRELKKKPWKPFRYEDLGVLSTIGRHKAVADLPYWKTQGVIAWFLWMFIHLIRLIGFRNRLVILVDWIWSYVTYEYSFRLITQPFRKEKCRVCEGG